jgi:hypothetical protein
MFNSAPLIPMNIDPEYDLQPSQLRGVETWRRWVSKRKDETDSRVEIELAKGLEWGMHGQGQDFPVSSLRRNRAGLA